MTEKINISRTIRDPKSLEEDSMKDEFWSALAILGHPLRRKIISRLRKGSANISQLEKDLDKAWTTIAHHLDVLEEAEVLTSEYIKIESPNPGGFAHVYSIDNDKLEALIAILEEGTKVALAF